MPLWLRTVFAVLLVCAVPLAATMLLAQNAALVKRQLPNLLSFGVGVLFASAGLHLVPEAVEHHGVLPAALLTGVGFATFYTIERLLAGHDHDHVHGLAMGAPHAAHPPHPAHAPGGARSILPIAFGADALHNFTDGILIAATFLVRPELGMLTALAVGLHELPREIGTFSLFVHGGLSPRRAVLFNALTALFALAGAGLTLLIGSRAETLASFVLPFAAGTMLYIGGTVARSVLPPVDGVVPVRRVGWVAAGGLMVALLIAGH
ncbi:MAG: ZIP family metal transporter [Gemmatimonadaceae bacterium]|jgi:zinc and cadmium transporter|nr:ZIP family metal transporter [Gemmatimonadaceae bacterium]